MLSIAESQTILPYFPKSKHIKIDDVSVWWFDENFCQSRYGENRNHGTNSCTLIVVLTANRIASKRIDTTSMILYRLQKQLVVEYCKAILDANSVYAALDHAGRIENVNFNIPEAMAVISEFICRDNCLQEWFYVHVKVPLDTESYQRDAALKLFHALKDGLQMWSTLGFKKDYIFVILIGDSRSILITFQFKNRVATIFDSHCHNSEGKGAVIAQTQWNNLHSLTYWIADMFTRVYNRKPKVYELSFIPLKD